MASTASGLRLLVVGGSGFVGQHIVKAALLRGANVTSMSRSGAPAFSGPSIPVWATKVDWASADALVPASYEDLLSRTDAVIFSVGTFLEDPRYKQHVREGNILGLAGAVASQVAGNTVGCAAKAVERTGVAASMPTVAAALRGVGALGRSAAGAGGAAQRGSVYDKVNRDSALLMAQQAALHPSVRSFVFLSAADVPPNPILDRRYVEAKREAERGIAGAGKDKFRTVAIRPGLIYSDERPFTVPMAAALSLPSYLPTPLRRVLPVPAKPLHVSAVAAACVGAAVDDSLVGVLEGQELERVAGR